MTKRNSIPAIAVLAVFALVGCNGPNAGTTTTEPGAAIDDGEWFAMVTVGEDESGESTLGVDLAEMLTGEEAEDTAVEDGFISEGEDLPNDFYIRNPENASELLHFADAAEILVISSTDTSEMISISPEDLEQLYEGTHPDGDIYYLAANTPIPMDVTISNGEVTRASQVYLP